ncbi:MAG: ATPase [Bacteroidaceae bacterium]|nr:ATPase [Bacteroidaceae bacterium]
MVLIADSGSSKTDWILAGGKDGILEIRTQGINPVRDDQDAILRLMRDELMPALPHGIDIPAIHFFGAGCVSPFSQSVTDSLATLFPHADIHVGSDLLGAAIALCGDQPGIACILGTGSNSGLYDGTRITQNVPPLGFILGDEGSGAVLGRTLVGNLLKGVFPTHLKDEFLHHFQLTPSDIITRVYRQPQPNRFLASLVPFIALHRDEPSIHQMLVEAFRLFFDRNIRPYGRRDLAVHCVGGIAAEFAAELREAAWHDGYIIGKIIRRPAPQIANFYQNTCYKT